MLQWEANVKRFKWYLRMIYEFARISFKSQIEYRLNFIAGAFVEIAYMLIKIVYLIVVIRSGVKIGGLTPEMITIFVGTYIFMTGIWMMLSGINSIPKKVIRGELDFLVVKPGPIQFMQTLGRFDFAMAFPNVTAGIVIICVGWHKANIPVNFTTTGGFLFFLACGIFLTYGFTMIPALLVFWVTSLNGISTFFASLWDFNNMPMEMYGKIIKNIGTFIIPVFLITNWSGLFVLNKLSSLEILWGILAPVIMFFISKFMWNKGLKRYTSANG